MKFDLKLLGKNSIYIEAQSKKCVTEVLSALSRKSPDTLYHSIDFANRIVHLKNIFKLSAEQVSHLYTAALVHDAGKVSIEQELLSRKGMSRMDVLKFIGLPHIEKTQGVLSQYLKKGQLSKEVYLLALHHHEKLDGSGYPNGLKKAEDKKTYHSKQEMVKENELTIYDALFSAVDVLSALSMKRAYRDRILTPAERCEIMYNKVSNKEQDLEVVDKVISTFIQKDMHNEK